MTSETCDVNLESHRGDSAVVHGGPDLLELRRLGLDPAKVLDFSICVNPFGPSPRVREALSHVRLAEYPDRDAHDLRQALAEKHAISSERILAGNGASELIWLTALAFVRPGDRVLVIGPTYGEYARAAALQGAEIRGWNASEEDGFTPRPDEIERAIDSESPRLVFLCNPNNPTGSILAPGVILAWVREHADTLFVVDEAYHAFAGDWGSLAANKEKNLLVLRSMTKDYALAGLRVGYSVGSPEIIAELARVRPPWSVSSVAQAAAVAALGDETHLARTLHGLGQAQEALTAELERMGLEPWYSATHYFLVRVGSGSAFRLALLKRGILVRDATSFGLPAFARLATRTAPENARLLAVLREVSW